jgi:hypothetical protein
MSALTISAYRMPLAALVLILGMALVGRSAEVGRLIRERPLSVPLVGLATASYQTLYFGSMVAVGASVATVVTLGLAPVLLTASSIPPYRHSITNETSTFAPVTRGAVKSARVLHAKGRVGAARSIEAWWPAGRGTIAG